MRKLLILASAAVLTLAGSANAEIYFKEAEAADDLGNFTANLHASAYGGSYITASADSGGTAPALLPGAVYHMGAMPAGDYDLYVRMRVGPSTYSDDSFWIPNAFRESYDTATGWLRVNGLSDVGTATIEGVNLSGNFGWVKVVGVGIKTGIEGSSIPYTLAAATSDLIFSIAPRENGLDIDALALVTAGQTVTTLDLNPSKPPFVITGSGPKTAVAGDVEIIVTARDYSSTASSATVSVNGSVYNAAVDRSVTTNVVISYTSTLAKGVYPVEVIVTSASSETATNKWNLTVWEDSSGSATVVHHWDFNETSGTNVADKVGNMDGTVIGTNYAWQSGAIYLKGGGSSTDWNSGTGTATVGSYIDLPNGLLDTFTGATTFEIVYKDLGSANWARLYDFGQSNTNENMSSGTGGDSYVFLSPGNGSDAIQATVKRSPAGEFTSINDGVTKSIVSNLTYVVYTYDPDSDQAALFVNGKIIAAHVTMTNDIALSDINDVNNWIGRSQWPDPMFKGEIDDFKMSTGLLSSSQIAAEWARLNGGVVILPPVINSVSSLNNLFIIEYSTDYIGTYTIEHKTSLTNSWSVLTNDIGGGVRTVAVPMTSGATQEFYRVTGEE